ncbi:DUF6035 family protein [Variovorax guangxiensis]|uniref:DUF6035 domain-containing protein n=1 Tax=Variovorax guangxiensis TaxID=1775474 RepID=A0A840FN19_9BURK|nr:DUF6035 family protein [Variovorax guangxiensis]MBB4223946.1 hypothetical protein [Variovorax guangxiensis]
MQALAKQTVQLAIDCSTGELVSADSLSAMSEADFSALRREAMTARVQRKRRGSIGSDDEDTPKRFTCAICKHPLYLSRHVRGEGNRWFVHDGKSENCPWYEGRRLTPDQAKALVYRGQQEGLEHRAAKAFIAEWLARDPLASNICQEQTTFAEVIKGEWRRPDVKCEYTGKPVVFEIQLSYTFLSEVISRDAFYRREGIYIIWVFARFELHRAAVADEAFFNRRNLFVLDAAAKLVTQERQSLTFSGYRQVPEMSQDSTRDVWTSASVEMADVIFPPDTLRPYFFDYEAYRSAMEAAQHGAWRNGVDAYRDAALRYYDGGYAPRLKALIIEAVEVLSLSPYWDRSFEALRDEAFMGWQGLLPVLLSIQIGRPVGHAKCRSVFQVMESALQHSPHGPDFHGFAIFYLWAYKVCDPTMAADDRDWIRSFAREVKVSVEAGESRYIRLEEYEEAICLLFPELEMLLRWEDFGRR